MNDVLNTDQRSYCMSRIRASNTKPELALRKALWHQGYRYRVNTKLYGKPDIVFRGFQTVVFVDGCFWHKCPEHFTLPKTRSEFWRAKIDANVKRDLRNNEALMLQGWRVVRIWEHEIKASLQHSVARVAQVLEQQRNSH